MFNKIDSGNEINKIRKEVLHKLQLFRSLGSGSDLGNGRLWLLLDNSTLKTKKAFPNIITIHELLDVDVKDLVKGFKREWKKIFPSAESLREGLYSRSWNNSDWLTVCDDASSLGGSELPRTGKQIERSSDEAAKIRGFVQKHLKKSPRPVSVSPDKTPRAPKKRARRTGCSTAGAYSPPLSIFACLSPTKDN